MVLASVLSVQKQGFSSSPQVRRPAGAREILGAFTRMIDEICKEF
jgi:hypothetical protein